MDGAAVMRCDGEFGGEFGGRGGGLPANDHRKAIDVDRARSYVIARSGAKRGSGALRQQSEWEVGLAAAEGADFVRLSEIAYDRDRERSEAIVTLRRAEIRGGRGRIKALFGAEISFKESPSQAVQAESIDMRSSAIGRDWGGWDKMRSQRPASLKRD